MAESSDSLNDRIDNDNQERRASNDWRLNLAGVSDDAHSNYTNPMTISTFTNGKVTLSKYSDCFHAKASIVEPIYQKFADESVIINGPEFSLDYTYFLVDGFEDLLNLERPISVSDFRNGVPREENRQQMEFRII